MKSILPLCVLVLAAPAIAYAWGYEGHKVVAGVAQAFMTPATRAKVDAMLAADTDSLTAHDMASEATWADTYRNTHRETSEWHFVDLELDHPDLRTACFGFHPAGGPASAGPAKDCLVHKLEEFTAELSDAATPAPERLLALKFVLHFVGDVHQPLHTADNQDRGGNCVLLNLGGSRSVNLHSYWDTTVIAAMSPDPQKIATSLVQGITPAEQAEWKQGNPRQWAQESFNLAKSTVYSLGSRPGCDAGQGAISLPAGYEQKARVTISTQLQKAGVRLAAVLNTALDRP